MITFKEYLTEASPAEKEITQVAEKDLVKILGKGKVNALAKHPWFKEYSNWEKAFRHGVSRAGFHIIEVLPYFGHTHTTAEGKIRPTTMLVFTFSYGGTKVIQVYKYIRDKDPTEDEKKHGTRASWRIAKQWKDDEDAVEKAWKGHT